jgi:hypothetical protein
VNNTLQVGQRVWMARNNILRPELVVRVLDGMVALVFDDDRGDPSAKVVVTNDQIDADAATLAKLDEVGRPERYFSRKSAALDFLAIRLRAVADTKHAEFVAADTRASKMEQDSIAARVEEAAEARGAPPPEVPYSEEDDNRGNR